MHHTISAARPHHAGLLRHMYLPRAADALAATITTYAIPLLILATTGSPALTGLTFAMEWVPRLAMFGVAGSWVDRYGPARVWRTATAIRTGVIVLAAILLPFTAAHVSTWALMTLGAIAGGLTEVSFVAAETAGADASRRGDEAGHRIQGVLLGIDQGALLIGPAVGGLLIHGGATPMLVAVAVLATLAVAFPITTGKKEPAQPGTEQVSAAGALREGWRTVRALPALGWLVAGLAASNLSTGVLQASAPITVVHTLGHSTAAVGTIWSVAALATLLAITACRKTIDRWGLWPVGATAAAVVSAGCLTVALTAEFSLYIALVALIMAGEGVMTVVLRTLRSRIIPADVFGATLAVTMTLVLLPLPLAGGLVALTPAPQLPYLLTACAAAQGLVLATVFARLRTHTALRPTPVETAA
ncbi:MFS transporter [Streptomyces sp. NPDC056178]|uniref:MFS transporter n=1 Tax=unclassified Streptomyces TaxID=2593676 RepID=UPI0035E0E43F